MRFHSGSRNQIGEPRVENVLDRFLAQEVIDPEDRFFGKELIENAVQFPRRRKIAPERLFHHDARIFRAARIRQSFRYRGEHAGRDREIVQRPLRTSQNLAQLGEGRRIAVIAVHVLEQGRQLRERRLVQAAVRGDAVAGARLELVEIPSGFRNSDDGNVRLCRFTSACSAGKICL